MPSWPALRPAALRTSVTRWRVARPPAHPRPPRVAAVAGAAEAAFSAATVAAVAAYAVVAGRPRGRLVRRIGRGGWFCGRVCVSRQKRSHLRLPHPLTPQATWLTSSPLVPALGAATYLAVVAVCVPGAAAAAARAVLAAASPLPSVPAFATLFATPGATAAAWLHLLTLDFVQAAWVARDAAACVAGVGGGGSCSVPRLPVAHSLVLCFMAGPLGLLSHVVTRTVWRWRVG